MRILVPRQNQIDLLAASWVNGTDAQKLSFACALKDMSHMKDPATGEITSSTQSAEPQGCGPYAELIIPALMCDNDLLESAVSRQTTRLMQENKIVVDSTNNRVDINVPGFLGSNIMWLVDELGPGAVGKRIYLNGTDTNRTATAQKLKYATIRALNGTGYDDWMYSFRYILGRWIWYQTQDLARYDLDHPPVASDEDVNEFLRTNYARAERRSCGWGINKAADPTWENASWSQPAGPTGMWCVPQNNNPSSQYGMQFKMVGLEVFDPEAGGTALASCWCGVGAVNRPSSERDKLHFFTPTGYAFEEYDLLRYLKAKIVAYSDAAVFARTQPALSYAQNDELLLKDEDLFATGDTFDPDEIAENARKKSTYGLCWALAIIVIAAVTIRAMTVSSQESGPDSHSGSNESVPAGGAQAQARVSAGAGATDMLDI